MRQPNRGREIPGIPNGVNSAMNHHHHHHQTLSLHELHNHHDQPPSNFDPAPASQDELLEQMLSSSAFPWSDDHPPPDLTEALADHLDSKMGQQQISSGAVKAFMLQQQLLLSGGLATGGGMPVADLNNVVDSSNCANLPNDDASIKAFLNNFTGSLGQTSNQLQHFHHSQGGGLNQSHNFGAPAVSQAAASGSSGGGAAAGQQKQRVRARRGQATDPHSIAERLRRERIAERMKALQELVPNANKTDKASMLDEIIDYVKFLQLQVKVLSMSRLGGAAAVNPLVAAVRSPEGKSGIGAQMTASSSNNNNITNEGVTLAERQVAKLMEEDMGSAMQYLQGKGLCLMPISLATAISTATSSHPRNPLTAAAASNNPALLNNNNCRGPTSPTISVMTVQSATIGSNGGEVSLKDAPTLE